ncbi:TetR family transcriptional regulator [Aeromicrobium tamlense]|uniref:DNA-binding transcriptional regulator YbjK n=1 Tax=Aeromicrobium tamlense TaxID=375541 RepID=A0A8I0G1V1_9ACTN|nr:MULTISPECIES: TetR/AcrR family transcriptional regulator [Aeromicrobium]MBD1270484.1 TetR family transcriptional regulator [Aeromicrobium tamlense]MBD1271384.1 TetR family transcriptional regulator [Aeromicrobium tamlense]NYI37871.1 DNA-binding transcriptional regulator YbjK [Aeromicrobium tamlense]
MVRNPERRVRLADAAVRVLARQGSRGLTHRAIDDEAGVPKGTASNYFSSREEIIDAILARIGERLTPDPAVHAELARRSPGVDLFTDYLRDIVHRLTSDPDSTIALFELRLEATRRPHVAAALAEWRRGGLAADVEFNASMGLPGDAADIALFHYAIDGLVLDRLTVPLDEQADVDALVATLVRRILGD